MSATEAAHAQNARSLILLGDDLSGTTEALAASLGRHSPGSDSPASEQLPCAFRA